MKTKNIILAIIVIALVIILEIIVMGYYQKTIENVKNPIVTMEIEGYGTVKMELYPDQAPNTVANFIDLISNNYYDGLIFHRVMADMLIQGGDIEGTGSGKIDFAIKGEFMANNFRTNTIRHEEGTVSMARGDYSAYGLTAEGYNSAGSQFFICVNTFKGWDGMYAAFGKVIEGIDIVKAISKVPTMFDEEGNNTEMPKDEVVIKSMTVDTFGVKYKKPERNEPFDINEWYNNWLMDQYYADYDWNSIMIPED